MLQQGPDSNASEVSINNMLPYEVQRIILFSLQHIQRKAVTRVQRIWQYLDASVTPEEQISQIEEALIRKLFTAVTEGNKNALNSLLVSLKNEIKTQRIINSWLWLALRLAAKTENFECMPFLFDEYKFLHPANDFEHLHSTFFFEGIYWKHPVQFTLQEQKKIGENIDAMPNAQFSIVKSRQQFQCMLENDTKYFLRTLQVFIANDQADCVKFLLQEKSSSFSSLVKSNLLFLIVNHNRSQCLKLFLNHYDHLLFNIENDEQSHRAMLKRVIEIAAKEGYVESLEPLLLATRSVYDAFALPWSFKFAHDKAMQNNQQKCIDLLEKMKNDLNFNYSANKNRHGGCTLS